MLQARKQHAKVLTSTPNKEALLEKEEKKENKGAKANLQTNKANKRPAKLSIKQVKKRILQERENKSSSDSEIDMIDVRNDRDTDIEDLEKCVICTDYGRNNELWYRCILCGLWAHAECTGYDSPEGYVCDFHR